MKAPESIPYSLFNDYTMNGKVKLEYNYANDCSEEIQSFINDQFTKENFDNSLIKANKREQNYYGPTDSWLYEALEKYPIQGKHICIMGSTSPWYEAVAVSHGVKKCTVIEYSKREAFHPDIVYKQPHEIGDEKFDACFSISSYEHDGLGRYGDPLNPNGDLEAMLNTKNLIHENSLLFLSIPIGIDKVVFNVHRVYGKHREPLLLQHWEVVEKFGFTENSFSSNYNGVNGTPYQPLYVLRNT